MNGLRPSGTDPRVMKSSGVLPIETGGATPRRVSHGTYAKTLRAMEPGSEQWFRIKHNSRQAVYAAAKTIGVTVRIERFPDRTGARVWRLR